jgi:hypothetical protein
MRTKRAPRTGADARRPLAAVAAAGLLVATVAVLAGCSSGESNSAAAASSGTAGGAVAYGAPAALPASTPVPAGASAPAEGFSASAGRAASPAGDAQFAANSQKLIYTAQLNVRAPDVSAAVSKATSVVSAAGGYVSSENASSDPAHPSRATATVTFKIPAAGYGTTLAALSGTALGTQLSLTQQAQDVTQQVADVSSRVASDEAAIAQLRTLLKHAGSVGELLSVQDQINSEESDLESMLAQQNALDHETSYATVTLTVVGPKAAPKPAAKAAPPPGWTGGLSDGWHAFRLTISWLLTVLGTVLPFAAAVLVLAGLAWWGRRRFQRGRPPAA